MFGIPILSLPTKILIFLSILSLTTVFSAEKAYHYAMDKRDVMDSIATLKVVKVTKEVLVVDQQSLSQALVKQKAQLEKDHANEMDIAKWFIDHPPKTECEPMLDADGLRLWNNENTGAGSP